MEWQSQILHSSTKLPKCTWVWFTLTHIVHKLKYQLPWWSIWLFLSNSGDKACPHGFWPPFSGNANLFNISSEVEPRFHLAQFINSQKKTKPLADMKKQRGLKKKKVIWYNTVDMYWHQYYSAPSVILFRT